ncbi:endonuclease/exonuclease/phosphatase family protein [Pseudovibrio ascidiaceicola]|uniref:endonuclease/exonuclease/phosphatase family protein n=1 Tax=Pseudovibrio ascidiaceicola TaxID=285279 RepID=UPI003D36BABB
MFLRNSIIGVTILLLVSFLGIIHPVGDSLSVVRLPLAILLAVLTLFSYRQPTLMIAGFIVAIVSSASVLWAYHGQSIPKNSDMSVYQKNLSFRPGDRSDILNDILMLKPDVITFQEVHKRHLPLINTLKKHYPHHIVCPFAAVGAVAVLSRMPLASDAYRCKIGLGIAALHVQSPEGPLWVVSIHQHWPWPFQQDDQAEQIIPLLADLDGLKLIAGDFNMVPWSHNLDEYADATNTQLAGPFKASFLFKGTYAMRIDHVLAPKGGKTFLRPCYGSDHNGIFARVDL